MHVARTAKSGVRRGLGGLGLLALALIAALLLVVLAGFALGLFGLRSESDFASDPIVGEPIEPPADSSYGIVLGSYRAESGFSIFGWDIVDPEYRVNVGFVLPEGCIPPASGHLAADGACAGIPVEGDVSGGGTTSDGDALVIVAVEVSKACHQALERNDRWPSSRPECAE